MYLSSSKQTSREKRSSQTEGIDRINDVIKHGYSKGLLVHLPVCQCHPWVRGSLRLMGQATAVEKEVHFVKQAQQSLQ